jgi:hypothetical protein
MRVLKGAFKFSGRSPGLKRFAKNLRGRMIDLLMAGLGCDFNRWDAVQGKSLAPGVGTDGNSIMHGRIL